MTFRLDPRIAASSRPIARLTLCEARLQDDARFPWIVLVPQRAGLVEIAELDETDRAILLRETMSAGHAVHAIGRALGAPPLNLNHGQLGNVVAQLHVHVVGRHAGDEGWPGPVWGFGETKPYGAEALTAATNAAREALR